MLFQLNMSLLFIHYRFVCDCVVSANTAGHSIIGIQSFGECRSGPRAECVYNQYGQSRGCVNQQNRACSGTSSLLCAGENPNNNYVYVRTDLTIPPCSTTSTVRSPTTTIPKNYGRFMNHITLSYAI